MESSSKRPVVIAIDVGTGGTKLVAYDFVEGSQIISTAISYRTYSPQPGWMEQSANDWWKAVIRGLRFFWQKGFSPNQVAAIGLSGQMENCLLLDRNGRPLHPAILYSDSRATWEAAFINKRIGGKNILQFCGNMIDQATTVAKLLWLKNNCPDRYRSALTMVSGAKDYIAYRLTGTHATDPTNASTTGLMNIHSRKWEYSLVDDLGLDDSLLPPILSSTDIVGFVNKKVAKQTGLPIGCPVFCGLGDAGAANLGAGVVTSDRAHCYLGTTGWVATVKSEYPVTHPEGLFVLCGPEPDQYIFIAPLLNAGRAYDWVLKMLSGKRKRIYQEMEEFLPTVPCGSNGLFFLPYLVGERCPYRDPNATGAYFGLTDQTTRLEMIRATLEGVTFGIRQALEIIIDPTMLKEMTVIGGGSQSHTWVQMIADICGCNLTVPVGGANSPCLGATLVALIGLRVENSFLSIDKFLKKGQIIHPDANHQQTYQSLYAFYTKLYPTLKPLFAKRKALTGGNK